MSAAEDKPDVPQLEARGAMNSFLDTIGRQLFGPDIRLESSQGVYWSGDPEHNRTNTCLHLGKRTVCFVSARAGEKLLHDLKQALEGLPNPWYIAKERIHDFMGICGAVPTRTAKASSSLLFLLCRKKTTQSKLFVMGFVYLAPWNTYHLFVEQNIVTQLLTCVVDKKGAAYIIDNIVKPNVEASVVYDVSGEAGHESEESDTDEDLYGSYDAATFAGAGTFPGELKYEECAGQVAMPCTSQTQTVVPTIPWEVNEVGKPLYVVPQPTDCKTQLQPTPVATVATAHQVPNSLDSSPQSQGTNDQYQPEYVPSTEPMLFAGLPTPDQMPPVSVPSLGQMPTVGVTSLVQVPVLSILGDDQMPTTDLLGADQVPTLDALSTDLVHSPACQFGQHAQGQ